MQLIFDSISFKQLLLGGGGGLVSYNLDFIQIYCIFFWLFLGGKNQ